MLPFLHETIRFSAIFLFGSTGETITEKSGHLNLGIPGIMCLGALGGCFGTSLYLQTLSDLALLNNFATVIMGIIFSMLFAGAGGLIYGFLTISLRCNQNVSGLAITTFGSGMLEFFYDMTKNDFSSASIAYRSYIPGADGLGWFSDLFLTYGPLVYIAIVLAIVTSLIFKRTRTGLSLRAVGENPATADAAGINVTKYKYVSCILGAAIAGLGGLFYFMDFMTGGRAYDTEAMGWLAVALVIFSIWRPNIAILGSIIFAALYRAPDYLNVPFIYKELIKMIPFVVTIIVLIITSMTNRKETQPPAALGLSYFREER